MMNINGTLQFLIITIFCYSISALTSTYHVIHTGDSGPGSLRQAMIEADTSVAADTIVFNIPISDPGYNPTSGVWTIQPASPYPYLVGDSTFIDGRSQTVNQGDTNPHGPEIEINGTAIEESGFIIEGAFNKVVGLIINRFAYYGFNIQFSEARHNVIAGNYIGTDPSGQTALGNVLGGVLITGYADSNLIGGISPADRNVIGGATHHGNIYHGNGVTLKAGNFNRIIGNYIGTNKDGNSPLSNIDYGISITYGQENVVGGLEMGAANVISGNLLGGIFIRFTATTNNLISGNFIGTDKSGSLDLGNAFHGIYIDYGTKNNIIGPQNVIKNNGAYGIIIKHDTTTGNRITQNAISNHSNMGIFLEENANNAIPPPAILEVTDNYISGTATPNAIIEIFSDSSDEGSVYEGSVIADPLGSFLWTGSASGPNISATATDTAGNTSEFSAPYITSIKDDEYSHQLGDYQLSQNYPNPFNPLTKINYRLPVESEVELSIYNLLGQKVATLVSEKKLAGNYEVKYDASDLASGIYYYQLITDNFYQTRRMLLLK